MSTPNKRSMHDRQIHNFIRYLGLFGLLLFSIVCQPIVTHAQETSWREKRTANFALLFPAGAEAEAEHYAQFVDSVYAELSAIFSYRTPTPVPLRIYPTMELYYQANPLAANLPGVTAHAHTGRREISIALPQTAAQTEVEIMNNVRHELAHIIAADLSGDKLTTVFQEGIAQYVEHPTQVLDSKMQLLQQAIDAGQLLPWRDLNRPEALYANPHIGYPQSYAIVAFLIERDGFTTFKRFIELSKTSSGYRGAIQAAYGIAADQLEAEWRAQLDQFVSGGYREQQVSTLDLSRAETLIASGEYAAAESELQAILAGLPSSTPEEIVIKAERLLQRARDGQRLTMLAHDARTALERGDYVAAQQAASEGRTLLSTLQQPTQMAVMEEYLALARDGLTAQDQFAQAEVALRSLRIGEARSYLTDAYRTFTRLGDEQHATAAQAALASIQRTETLLAISLVVLGALVVGWNIHRRVNQQAPELPFG